MGTLAYKTLHQCGFDVAALYFMVNTSLVEQQHSP